MRRFLTLAGIALLSWWGIGRFTASGDAVWRQISPGVESRVLTRKTGFSTVSIYAFRALPSRIHLGTRDYGTASQWLAKSGARVVVNGGYFDGSGHPLGLRVSKGEAQKKLRNANWGVFWINKGRAHIVHTRDFDSKTPVTEAIQCGPRLVVNGQVTDLKDQWGRRTALGIDASGRVIIAVSDGELSLRDWAKLWSERGGLNCPDALNLDGGGSTQLAVKGRDDLQITGAWPVPDVVEIR